MLTTPIESARLARDLLESIEAIPRLPLAVIPAALGRKGTTLRTFVPRGKGIMTCVPTASTSAKMQTQTTGHSGDAENRSEYLRDRCQQLLLAPPCILHSVDEPSQLMQLFLPVHGVSPGYCQATCSPFKCEACVQRPSTKQGEVMLAMPATSVRRKSDCRECQVRLNLLREAFKVPHSLSAAGSITTVIR